jgi:hypothetical protein
MRRTKAALIYRMTGNLRAVQLLLGHTKMDSIPRSRARGCARDCRKHRAPRPTCRRRSTPPSARSGPKT